MGNASRDPQRRTLAAVDSDCSVRVTGRAGLSTQTVDNSLDRCRCWKWPPWALSFSGGDSGH